MRPLGPELPETQPGTRGRTATGNRARQPRPGTGPQVVSCSVGIKLLSTSKQTARSREEQDWNGSQ